MSTNEFDPDRHRPTTWMMHPIEARAHAEGVEHLLILPSEWTREEDLSYFSTFHVAQDPYVFMLNRLVTTFEALGDLLARAVECLRHLEDPLRVQAVQLQSFESKVALLQTILGRPFYALEYTGEIFQALEAILVVAKLRNELLGRLALGESAVWLREMMDLEDLIVGGAIFDVRQLLLIWRRPFDPLSRCDRYQHLVGVLKLSEKIRWGVYSF